jgi:hypothetical protein
MTFEPQKVFAISKDNSGLTLESRRHYDSTGSMARIRICPRLIERPCRNGIGELTATAQTVQSFVGNLVKDQIAAPIGKLPGNGRSRGSAEAAKLNPWLLGHLVA